MSQYIYNLDRWPQFVWDPEALLSLLANVRNRQGILMGKMDALGFRLQNEAYLESLSRDVVKSSEIEGEMLDTAQVRSSIARSLGMDPGGLVKSERVVDGVVEMMMDATQNWQEPLSADRLCGWHASLFPSGRSGMHKIQVGRWRKDTTGPMQVVSGPKGKETVHFEAPSSDKLPEEMKLFISWVNTPSTYDPVLKAAIAHIWFITLHPFDDGNGRISRALSDMLLCRSEGKTQRFYSMSSQIREQKEAYYSILEETQKGSLDITDWLIWFLECLKDALESSEKIVNTIMAKHSFWNVHKSIPFNERQLKMIDLLFGKFYGNLTTSKWAKINKCSQDTALRDIQDLVKKGILRKAESGGRSSSYHLVI